MTLDIQFLSDRLEIQEAIHQYSVGLDERRWSAWDRSFTGDGIIDFSPGGGRREPISQMRQRLDVADPSFVFAQHPVTNTLIELNGDQATAHSEFTWESGKRPAGGAPNSLVRISGGGSYDDELIRTASGWRISLRIVRVKWRDTRTIVDELARA